MSPQIRKRRPYAARVPMVERREQLLDAALTVIDRDGFDRVSIDAVARQAGVTRPVVYGAFDDLGALLGSLLDRQQSRALEQLYAALPLDQPGAGLVELFEHTVPALHQMVLADPLTWRAILTSGAAAPKVMQERIETDRVRVRETIASFLAAWTGDEADNDLFAHATLATLEHFGRLVLTNPDEYTAQRLLRAVLSILPAVPGHEPSRA